jgi:hypothetical protein
MGNSDVGRSGAMASAGYFKDRVSVPYQSMIGLVSLRKSACEYFIKGIITLRNALCLIYHFSIHFNKIPCSDGLKMLEIPHHWVFLAIRYLSGSQ